MAIETLIHTERSLAAATRVALDRLLGAGFETIDAPEDGRLEVDCLDGDTGEEWGVVAPPSTAMEVFQQIKERPTTVRVSIKLEHGHILVYPGFVALSRPEAEYEAFEDDDRAKQIALREAFELSRTFGAREVLLAGDAATDFLGTEATSWEGLKDVLEEESIPHTVLPVPAKA